VQSSSQSQHERIGVIIRMFVPLARIIVRAPAIICDSGARAVVEVGNRVDTFKGHRISISHEVLRADPSPVLGNGPLAHRDVTVAFRGLNDDRNIVAERCQDHDQARFRVAVDVPAQDSRDIGLADASPGGISRYW
jgi:hypothetical protein